MDSESFGNYSLLRYPPGYSPRDQTDLNIRDINSLKKGKYLTDQCVDFWLKYVQTEKLSPEIQETVYTYSSLFYTSLLRGSTLNNNGPNGRRRHSRRISVDIFQKDFLVFPVVVDAHWQLVIVCYAENSNGEPRSKRPRTVEGKNTAEEPPMIIILDSYRAYNKSSAFVLMAAIIRSFLTTEWKVHRGETDFEFSPENLPLQIPDLPQQSNLSDCGVYILQFFEGFFTKPFGVPLLTFFETSADWIYSYTKNIETDKREQIYQTMLSLLRSKQHQLFPNACRLLPKTTAGLPVSEKFSQAGFLSLFANEVQITASESRKAETAKVIKDFFKTWKQTQFPNNTTSTNNNVKERDSESGPVEFEAAQASLGIDASKPCTKVTVRLADGSRYTITLNVSQPVSTIRQFICQLRPSQASKIFSLVASYPCIEINESLTIQDANLNNSVVTQQMK